MQQTPNYNLKKIELADSPPDITVLDDNLDTIDQELKKNADAAQDAQQTADSAGSALASHLNETHQRQTKVMCS